MLFVIWPKVYLHYKMSQKFTHLLVYNFRMWIYIAGIYAYIAMVR